jgi:hypothetical protein
MQKSFLIIIVYLLADVLLLTIPQLSPTNMAGPGLDIVVFFAGTLAGIIIVIRSVIRLLAKKSTRSRPTINLIGSVTMLILIYYLLNKEG